MTQVLVRNEILDQFDRNDDIESCFLHLFQAADYSDFPPVGEFTFRNSKVNDLDADTLEYLKTMKVDTDDILLVSSYLAQGFITTMRGYTEKLNEILTGNNNEC